MNRKNLFRVSAFGLLTLAAAGTAAAFETPYNGVVSGPIASTQIDAVNPGDGVKGVLGTFSITTEKFGQVSGQALVEDVPAVTPSGTCPPSTDLELALGAIHGIHRFPNGELLYLIGHTRTACVDLDTFTAVAHEAGEFAGGTGQFAQATGTWDITDDINLMVSDPAGELFGAFTGKLKGTLITPGPIRMNGH